MSQIVPPPPAIGSPRDKADLALFHASRRQRGSPRWALAQADVDTAQTYKTFACAIGVQLDSSVAPETWSLLSRVSVDVSRIVDLAKSSQKRPRPYTRASGGICVARSKGLDATFDYPSGHSFWSWTVGLLFAEMTPDRSTEILRRAKAVGDGRVTCGVHSYSAVEAGRTSAAVLVAALHGDAAFRRDLVTAGNEIAAARARGPSPDPARCRAEAAALATPAE